ncbi:50S ribosomal protein L11 [candidate division WWE3 bacterium]|nr:50S ribosomal protein L11 [candidate division WWE3 bacterium]
MAEKKGKKIKALVKLNIQAGRATPGPPIGPALGQHGVGLMDFCKEFNERTKNMGDDIIPIVMTVFDDRTFTFVTKTPVTSSLILKELKLAKGSGVPNKNKVGKLSKAQIENVAKIKMPDLNAKDVNQAVKVIAGTARSMGVEVEL